MSGLSNTQGFTRTTDRTNQGIVDVRPEGHNPQSAPVKLDTVVDKDASGPTLQTSASDMPNGATSADVYQSAGKPGSGMTSKELHNNGHAHRKEEGQGVSQWGPPGTASVEFDRSQRETGRDREAFVGDQ
ncbi:hypothetical protein Moror_8429 [Moniliophthora roreri MCA 2997]|uniref:Uncharacterized protein n=2 Tax=Moniliophthora roreri TaxID=221103 RepID=V2WP38_MONRO|nr:hypothetical protein Moror_8429 [Moniliophthora roreri MCA 2997]